MKKTNLFILINVIFILAINIICSLVTRTVNIRFLQKWYFVEMVIFLIPLYLIIIESVIFPKAEHKRIIYNSKFSFLIIYVSNALMYLIDRFILDEIFNVMPDLDNLIFFVAMTILQCCAVIVVRLILYIFIKIKCKFMK